MDIRNGFIGAIGNTPLIRLNGPSQETGCEILGKAEYANPGGSVKDRAALYIVREAEQSGQLKPGGIIVEGTAGNTGIGLAQVANALGYRCVIVIPDTQSQEKKDMLRLCGADLREVPAVPYRDPENYIHVSRHLAEELNESDEKGAIWANQFDNTANRQAHIETTGPEIWHQTGGKVDGFICAVGTGGTLAGVEKALRLLNRNVKIGLADPMGAALYNYYANGELKSEGSSITEGELLNVTFDLLSNEGLCLGGSSGINVAGAMRMARDLGPGHTIVTMLCDSGTRYMSKMFNPVFLREKNLPVPDWLA